MLHRTGFIVLTGIVITLAFDDLSDQKHATQSTTYPGSNDIYKAGNAVDRNTATCMRTEIIGPNSPYKTVWWKVDLGEVYSIYSVNILFKNYDGYEFRQRGRFAGFSLYISNTEAREDSTLCYKDGPQLPPLNFTITCITSGRYVIFYNERMDGVSYPDGYEITNILTELCEVFVFGCNISGVYGSSCDIPCPVNCRNNTCHILNGECFGCRSGWTGSACNTTCSGGWYGLDCTQQCIGLCLNQTSCNHVTGQCDAGCGYGLYGQYCNETCIGHCIHNASCNRETGLCEGGCAAGWNGTNCNKACTDGTFGIDCTSTCSGQCVDDSPCNKQTGYCDMGCNPGYTNIFCSGSCVQSYGEDCRYLCSKHCLNKTCNEFNGKCLYGCEMGFYGDKCDEDICSHREKDQNLPSSVWIYIGPICLGINILVIIILSLCLWGFYTKRLLIKTRSRLKSEHYAETEVVPEDNSHFQELGVPGGGNPYLNTTLN